MSGLLIVVVRVVVVIGLLFLGIDHHNALLFGCYLLDLKLEEITNLVVLHDHLLAKLVGDESGHPEVEGTEDAELLNVFDETGQNHASLDFLDVEVDAGVFIVSATHLVYLIRGDALDGSLVDELGVELGHVEHVLTGIIEQFFGQRPF